MYSRELLNENVRSKLSPNDAIKMAATIKEDLDDDALLEKLRQVRNIFARGGEDLSFDENEFGVDCLVKMMTPLLHNFIETEWLQGLELLFQILFNSGNFYASSGAIVDLYFSEEKLSVFLEKLVPLEAEKKKVSNLLCACLYNDYRLGKKVENGKMAVLHCLNYCINDPDGWLILLLGELYKRKLISQFFDEIHLAANCDELCTIVEFLVDHIRTADESRTKELLTQIRELFFTLCNHVLIVKSDKLPFGVQNSILLKNFFELFGSLSGRDRKGIRTEPMVVTVCGIAKRCHELANERHDELQARLSTNGEIEEKSDFINVMIDIWKDAIRILGNILDTNDPKERKSLQTLVLSLNAIPAILGACGPNHVNQIRNWALQTVNQLTLNNLETQAAIEELEKLADVENRDVSVDRDADGKYHFKRISHKN